MTTGCPSRETFNDRLCLYPPLRTITLCVRTLRSMSLLRLRAVLPASAEPRFRLHMLLAVSTCALLV